MPKFIELDIYRIYPQPGSDKRYFNVDTITDFFLPSSGSHVVVKTNVIYQMGGENSIFNYHWYHVTNSIDEIKEKLNG